MIKDTAASCHAARSLLSRLDHGWVDPYFHWTRWRMGRAGEKSLWMSGIGSGEHGRPRSDAFVGQAVMHVGGRLTYGLEPGRDRGPLRSRKLDPERRDQRRQ